MYIWLCIIGEFMLDTIHQCPDIMFCNLLLFIYALNCDFTTGGFDLISYSLAANAKLGQRVSQRSLDLSLIGNPAALRQILCNLNVIVAAIQRVNGVKCIPRRRVWQD